MTAEQAVERLRNLRESIRRHWGHPGVKAAVEFLEMTAARMQREGLMPGAGEHGAGAGYGAGVMALALRNVLLSEEEEQPHARND